MPSQLRRIGRRWEFSIRRRGLRTYHSFRTLRDARVAHRQAKAEERRSCVVCTRMFSPGQGRLCCGDKCRQSHIRAYDRRRSTTERHRVRVRAYVQRAYVKAKHLIAQRILSRTPKWQKKKAEYQRQVAQPRRKLNWEGYLRTTRLQRFRRWMKAAEVQGIPQKVARAAYAWHNYSQAQDKDRALAQIRDYLHNIK